MNFLRQAYYYKLAQRCNYYFVSTESETCVHLIMKSNYFKSHLITIEFVFLIVLNQKTEEKNIQ